MKTDFLKWIFSWFILRLAKIKTPPPGGFLEKPLYLILGTLFGIYNHKNYLVFLKLAVHVTFIIGWYVFPTIKGSQQRFRASYWI